MQVNPSDSYQPLIYENKITPLLPILSVLVSGCVNRRICSDRLFISNAIEDSLEQYINEIGPINEDVSIPTVAAIVVCAKENMDTTVSICIQKGYPPIPPAPADSGNCIPPIEKGLCHIRSRICCVKYIGLTDCRHLINEGILRYDPVEYKELDAIDQDFLDRRVCIRPSEKVYKICGRDSIELIFRRIGPTEDSYGSSSFIHTTP